MPVVPLSTRHSQPRDTPPSPPQHTTSRAGVTAQQSTCTAAELHTHTSAPSPTRWRVVNRNVRVAPTLPTAVMPAREHGDECKRGATHGCCAATVRPTPPKLEACNSLRGTWAHVAAMATACASLSVRTTSAASGVSSKFASTKILTFAASVAASHHASPSVRDTPVKRS